MIYSRAAARLGSCGSRGLDGFYLFICLRAPTQTETRFLFFLSFSLSLSPSLTFLHAGIVSL